MTIGDVDVNQSDPLTGSREKRLGGEMHYLLFRTAEF
jgi:hypothetical protein